MSTQDQHSRLDQAAAEQGFTVVERHTYDGRDEVLVLTGAEADALEAADNGNLAHFGHGLIAGVEAAGRLRRRALENLAAPIAAVRRELRRDLADVMALDNPDSMPLSRAIEDAEDQAHYAATVRDLVEAYVRLGGNLELEDQEATGVRVPATPLYGSADIWRTIAELPGLDNATTIADDVVTRLAAAEAGPA